MQELKGELKLITATEEIWAIWLRLFDAHNNEDLVNLDIKNTCKTVLQVKIPTIIKELFCLAQGLFDSELYRVVQHILLETPIKTMSYSKIFQKRPKHMKPFTYLIKEWCEYKKKNTMAIRQISKLWPIHNFTNIDGDFYLRNWKNLKDEYHINGISMRAFIRVASIFLAQRSRRNERKDLSTRRRHNYI